MRKVEEFPEHMRVAKGRAAEGMSERAGRSLRAHPEGRVKKEVADPLATEPRFSNRPGEHSHADVVTYSEA